MIVSHNLFKKLVWYMTIILDLICYVPRIVIELGMFCFCFFTFKKGGKNNSLMKITCELIFLLIFVYLLVSVLIQIYQKNSYISNNFYKNLLLNQFFFLCLFIITLHYPYPCFFFFFSPLSPGWRSAEKQCSCSSESSSGI